MRYLLLSLCLACSLNASAEFKLKVTGPTEAKVGTMVILNTVETTAPVFNWIIPEKLTGKVIGGLGDCNQQLGFFPDSPGVYQFYIYGTDGKLASHVGHKVIVTGKSSPVDPPPIDPPPIDPPPVDPPTDNQFKGLFDLSKSAVTNLNTPRIQKLLYEMLSEAEFGPTLQDAQQEFENRFTRAMSYRKGEERDPPWWTDWYEAILIEMNNLNKKGILVNISQYQLAIQSVIKGLK